MRRRSIRLRDLDDVVPLSLPGGAGRGVARLGLKEADDAIRAAEENIGEHRYGLGILLRAKGIRANDEAPVRESLDLFKELDCPYQTARTGWLLGGEAREEAKGIFERLGRPSRRISRRCL